MKAHAYALATIGILGATGQAAAVAPAPLYAAVVSATPVTTQVSVPQQRCADEQGDVQRPTTGGGAVVGGILGGLAGNAIGAGGGRALATGIGAIAGALAGNGVEAASTPPVPVTTTNCSYRRATEYRIVGYDVVYELNGQRYTTRTARDPGARIALDVRPSGGSSYDEPQASPYDAPPVAALAPYPVAAAPAYPVYDAPAFYPSSPYGYDAPAPIVIEGGFGGGWHGHRGR